MSFYYYFKVIKAHIKDRIVTVNAAIPPSTAFDRLGCPYVRKKEATQLPHKINYGKRKRKKKFRKKRVKKQIIELIEQELF